MADHSDIRVAGEGLALRRGGRLLLQDLDFSLKSGQMLWLKGRNGSGKTSFIRALMGLTPFAGGRLLVDGTPVDSLRDRASWLGHAVALKPHWSLADNLAVQIKLMGGATVDDADLIEAAQALGLAQLLEQPCRFLSSGQRRRAGLMRFLLQRRPIWLMDEPTVGLDRDSRGALSALMDAHLAAGGAILAASHEPLESGQADAAVLDIGRFVAKPEESVW